jgi:hypothetical protein
MMDVIDAFFSDPDLVELLEQVKCSDDIFDVIDLNETQHSNMLAWCLNPNEGHGQGDAVIKDFLIAAYNQSESSRFDNKQFFSIWTPGTIRTTNFGSAFVAREFSIMRDDIKKGRLDLFIIDPLNKILIVVENKCRARLNATQLSDYHGAVKQQIARRGIFKEYEAAFIVLDEGLESYEDDYIKSLGNKWIFLDYSWLKNSGKRARLQVEKGNQAAQLLVAYCQKQAAWNTESEKRLSELAASLSMSHESVVKALREIVNKDVIELTPTDLRGPLGELLLFSKQHRELCQQLIRSQGIASIQLGIKRSLPHLSSDQIETGRSRLSFVTPPIESLMKLEKNGYWPMYVNVFRETGDGDGTPKFTVRLVWRQNELNEAIKPEELRARFQERFPDLKKFGDSDFRRVVVARRLDPNTAITKSVALAKSVTELIEAHLETVSTF